MKNQQGLSSSLIKLQKAKSDTLLLYTSVCLPHNTTQAIPSRGRKAGLPNPCRKGCPVPQHISAECKVLCFKHYNSTKYNSFVLMATYCSLALKWPSAHLCLEKYSLLFWTSGSMVSLPGFQPAGHTSPCLSVNWKA